jgi:hypothetical protein
MRMRTVGLLLLVALVVEACRKSGDSGDGGEDLMTIDDFCPGQPHCTGEGDGLLRVGVARRSIVPELVETAWNDSNGNFRWGSGEAFVDSNLNGVFDAHWLAGFGYGRVATATNDEISVVALSLQWNDVSVAIAYVDVIGLFEDELERIRAEPALQSLGIDHILLGATHTHEAPDTAGLWGPDELTRGVNDEYMALLRTRTADAIVAAVAAAQPARMHVAQVVTESGGSTLAYVNDVRDPVIYDPTLTIVRFTDDASPTTTLATLVNWASHPEYTGRENNLMTADYVYSLRRTIDEELGGTTLFVQGAIGGQIGPGGPVVPLDSAGNPVIDDGVAKAEAAGRSVALLALDAIEGAPEVAGETDLEYRTAEIFVRVENRALQLANTLDILERDLYLYDTALPPSPENVPYVRSRVTFLRFGPVGVITTPGELHPELWVGGYDGSWSWGRPMLTETENAPDLSEAPDAPYLRDVLLGTPGVEYGIVAGLNGDWLGYIIPEFNFVVPEDNPYLSEADGDHYEETYSVGPLGEEQIVDPMFRLLRHQP